MNRTCPVTKRRLRSTELIPNLALRQAIHEYFVLVVGKDDATWAIDPARLKLGTLLNKSDFGVEVWDAILSDSSGGARQLALKAITTGPEFDTTKFHEEIKELQQASIRCPNVAKLLGMCIKDNKYCILMKRYKSNAPQLCHEQGGRLTHEQACRFALDLAKALAALHGEGIIVRDVKPTNVLVENEGGGAVLADVGLSHVVRASLGESWVPISMGAAGAAYLAPEQWDPELFGGVSTKADVWGLACTITHLATGKQPWEGFTMKQISRRVAEMKQTPKLPSDLHADLREILLPCMAFNPYKRPSAKALVAQFSSLCDLMFVRESNVPASLVLQDMHKYLQERESEIRKQAEASAQLEKRMQRWQETLARKERELQIATAALEQEQSSISIQRRNEMLELRKAGRTIHYDAMANHAAQPEPLSVTPAKAEISAPPLKEGPSKLEDAGAIEPLVDMLGAESEPGRAEAAAALRQMADANDRMLDVISEAGALPRLVGMLKDAHADRTAEEAVAAVKSLVGRKNHANRQRVAEAGGIAPLVSMLSGKSGTGQQLAAGTLRLLTEGEYLNKLAVVQAGALRPLARLLKEGSAEAKESAAMCIANLCEHSAEHGDIASDAGAIPPLVGLLRNGNSTGRTAAAMGLASIARGGQHLKVKAMLAGVTDPLMSLLKDPPDQACSKAATALIRQLADTQGSQHEIGVDAIAPLVTLIPSEDAAVALRLLCARDAQYVRAVAEAGACGPLIEALGESTTASEQEAAAFVIGELAGGDDEAKVVLDKGGAIEPLVRLCKTAPDSVRAAAARALGLLSRGSDQVKEKVCWEGAVEPLVAMLRGQSSDAKEAAAFALRHLPGTLMHAQPLPLDIDEAGPIGPLLKLLEGGTVSGREAAAWAMGNLKYPRESDSVQLAELACIAPLVDLLRDGSDDGKEAAAIALRRLLHHQNNVFRARDVGAVGPLAAVLWSCPPSAKEPAAACLAVLCNIDSACADAACEAGAFHPALSLLTRGDPNGVRAAAELVDSICEKAAARASSEQAVGWIPLLVRAATSSADSGARAAAIESLSQLTARHSACCTAARQEGAPLALCPILNGHPPHGERPLLCVLHILHNLSCLNELEMEPRETDSLVGLLRSTAVAAITVKLVCNLLDSETCKAHLLGAGVVSPLQELLSPSNQNDSERETAAWCIGKLGAIRDEVTLNDLADLLRGSRREAHDAASFALSKLLQLPENCAAARATGCVDALATLVGDQDPPLAAIKAVGHLACSDESSLAALIEAGLLESLSRLAATTSVQLQCASVSVIAALLQQYQSTIEPMLQLALEPLVQVLCDCETPEGKRDAATALGALSSLSTATQDRVASAGALSGLVTLLRSAEGRTAAMGALAKLAADHAPNQVKIVAAGAVQLCATVVADERALSMDRAAAVSCIGSLVDTIEDAKLLVIQLGLVPQLVVLLASKEALIHEAAAAALENLAYDSAEAKAAIVSAGAIPQLVALLNEGGAEVREAACGALGNLAHGAPKHRTLIADAGAVAFMSAALKEERPIDEREAAAWSLGNLADDDWENKARMMAAGVIDLLVVLLWVGEKGTLSAAEAAAYALGNITFRNYRAKMNAVSAGILPPLVALLRTDVPGARIEAMHCIRSLAEDHGANRAEVGKLGAIEILATRTGGAVAATDEQLYAAQTIELLTRSDDNNVLTFARAGGVPGIVALLQDGEPPHQRAAAQVLGNLANCEGASQIVSQAGALPLLVRLLAEGDVECMEAAAFAIGALAEEDESAEVAKSGAAPHLVRALTLPSAGARTAAATAVRHLASTRAQHGDVGAFLVPLADALDPLMEMLRSGDQDAKAAAAGAIDALCCKNSIYKAQFAAAGALGMLVDLLKSSHPAGRASAAAALRSVAMNNAENEKQLIRCDAVLPLVQLLHDGTEEGKSAASLAIAHLADLDGNVTKSFIDAGAVRPLVLLLRHGELATRIAACRALEPICRLNTPARRNVGELDGSAATVALLAEPAGREAAAALLRELTRGAAARVLQQVTQAGGMKMLTSALADKASMLDAATVIAEIADAPGGTQRMVAVEAGTVQLLLSLLSSDDLDTRPAAARALERLLYGESPCVPVAVEAGGIRDLTAAIRQAATRDVSAKALLHILQSDSSRRQEAAACGAVRPLVATMQAAATASGRQSAVLCLAELCKDDPPHATRLEIRDIDAIGPIVRAMVADNMPPDGKAGAARAVELLSVNIHGLKDAVLNAGAATAVVAMLAAEEADTLAAGASCLETLAAESSRVQDAASEVIPMLSQMLKRGERSVVEAAAGALRNMVVDHKHNKAAALGADAATLLTKVIGDKHHSHAARELAAWALANLIHGSASGNRAATDAGAPTAIAAMLREKDLPSPSREAAAWLIGNLADTNESNRGLFGVGEVVEQLVSAVADGSSIELREAAAWALSRVCHSHYQNKVRATTAGGMPAVVKLLEDRSAPDAQLAAAMALECLCAQNAPNKELALAAQALPALGLALQRGQPELQEAVCWALIEVLENSSENIEMAKAIIKSSLQDVFDGGGPGIRLAAGGALRLLGLLPTATARRLDASGLTRQPRKVFGSVASRVAISTAMRRGVPWWTPELRKREANHTAWYHQKAHHAAVPKAANAHGGSNIANHGVEQLRDLDVPAPSWMSDSPAAIPSTIGAPASDFNILDGVAGAMQASLPSFDEAAVRSTFNLIDTSNNGTLSKAELLRAIRSDRHVAAMLGLVDGVDARDEQSISAFTAAFERGDSNKSNDIDVEEFVVLCRAITMEAGGVAMPDKQSYIHRPPIIDTNSQQISMPLSAPESAHSVGASSIPGVNQAHFLSAPQTPFSPTELAPVDMPVPPTPSTPQDLAVSLDLLHDHANILGMLLQPSQSAQPAALKTKVASAPSGTSQCIEHDFGPAQPVASKPSYRPKADPVHEAEVEKLRAAMADAESELVEAEQKHHHKIANLTCQSELAEQEERARLEQISSVSAEIEILRKRLAESHQVGQQIELQQVELDVTAGRSQADVSLADSIAEADRIRQQLPLVEAVTIKRKLESRLAELESKIRTRERLRDTAESLGESDGSAQRIEMEKAQLAESWRVHMSQQQALKEQLAGLEVSQQGSALLEGLKDTELKRLREEKEQIEWEHQQRVEALRLKAQQARDKLDEAEQRRVEVEARSMRRASVTDDKAIRKHAVELVRTKYGWTLPGNAEDFDTSIRAAFDHVDTNKNGRLSKAELLKAVRTDSAVAALLGLTDAIDARDESSIGMFTAAFERADVDRSNDIDVAEFISLCQAIAMEAGGMHAAPSAAPVIELELPENMQSPAEESMVTEADDATDSADANAQLAQVLDHIDQLVTEHASSSQPGMPISSILREEIEKQIRVHDKLLRAELAKMGRNERNSRLRLETTVEQLESDIKELEIVHDQEQKRHATELEQVKEAVKHVLEKFHATKGQLARKEEQVRLLEVKLINAEEKLKLEKLDSEHGGSVATEMQGIAAEFYDRAVEVHRERDEAVNDIRRTIGQMRTFATAPTGNKELDDGMTHAAVESLIGEMDPMWNMLRTGARGDSIAAAESLLALRSASRWIGKLGGQKAQQQKAAMARKTAIMTALAELGPVPPASSMSLHDAAALLLARADKAAPAHDGARNEVALQHGLKVATAVISGKTNLTLKKNVMDPTHVPWGL